MRTSLLDAIGRGVANLQANWELVLVQLVKTLLLAFLTLVGLAPILYAMGITSLDLVADQASLEARLGALLDNWPASVGGLGPLLVAGLAASLVWGVATLVWCYFEAGTVGILAAGERQCPPGGTRAGVWFRTFSLAHLSGWGRLYLWRYFWLLNLILLVWLAVLLVLLVPAALVFASAASQDPVRLLWWGCSAALPVGFVLLALSLWSRLALTDAGRDDSGVRRACQRGVSLLGRRLGAMLSLAAILFAVGLLFVGLGLVVSLVTNLALPEPSGARLAIELLGTLVQVLVGAALSIALYGTLLALLRDPPEREERVS